MQLIHDPERAGRALLTLGVAELNETISRLAELGIAAGKIVEGVIAGIALITDPEGNTITLAEPDEADSDSSPPHPQLRTHGCFDLSERGLKQRDAELWPLPAIRHAVLRRAQFHRWAAGPSPYRVPRAARVLEGGTSMLVR